MKGGEKMRKILFLILALQVIIAASTIVMPKKAFASLPCNYYTASPNGEWSYGVTPCVARTNSGMVASYGWVNYESSWWGGIRTCTAWLIGWDYNRATGKYSPSYTSHKNCNNGGSTYFEIDQWPQSGHVYHSQIILNVDDWLDYTSYSGNSDALGF